MYLRTTNIGTNNTMLDYMMTQEAQYNKLSQIASSGKKVTEPSDDPSAVRSILNINSKMSQLQSYLENMSMAQQEVNTLDDTLTSLGDLIQDATDLATQAANGTYSDSDLDGIKSQIDSIIDSVISLANTDYNGTYIFSGTNTNTPAYTVTKDGSGNITGITYNGTDPAGDYQRKVTISDGVSVGVNAAGISVFGEYDSTATPAVSSGLFGTLMTLSANLGAHDQTAISSNLHNLTTAADAALATQTKFATVSNKFTMTTTSIKETVLGLKEYKSELQDADLAEVLTQLASAKNSLEATYSVTSQLLSGKSLLDYL